MDQWGVRLLNGDGEVFGDVNLGLSDGQHSAVTIIAVM